MKNRNLPFGYSYENGRIIVHPTESIVVKQIFRDYLDGDSLLTIANRLNAQQVEYTPGVIGWNKARVMRIIEDTRYMGGNGYPTLIDGATHAEAQEQKCQKYKMKDLDRQADIFKLAVPVLCPKCGSEMTRHHDSRLKCQQRWICKNHECRTFVKIEDVRLLEQITELLNSIIRNPGILRDVTVHEYEAPAEVRKIENEIGRGMEMATMDAASLIAKMMDCVSLKYKALPAERNTAMRLRADFESRSPLAVFSADLTNKTASAIRLNENGIVTLVLLNGQIIRRE